VNSNLALDYQPSPAITELPDEVFRNYDIRGFATTQISPYFGFKLGAALALMLKDQKHSSIYIGRDSRLSSPELAEALCAGLIQHGMNVIDLGAVSTPVVNFAVQCGNRADCGVMVTASHNPKDYNGFKIVVRDQVIAGETLQKIKRLMQSEMHTASQPGQLIAEDLTSNYLKAITDSCSTDRNFKIVVDSGNSIAGPLAVKLFKQLNCDIVPLFCEPDGNFPNHDPNPSDEKNLQQLKETVLSHQADIGFALDGDGDRLVAISGNGKILWPDQLLMIFAKDILGRHPNTDIVFDVKSSYRLHQLIRDLSGNPVMCKTGHSHVRRAVQSTGALVGGEFSGHIFFNDRWHGFDDGLYAAIRLLEILSHCKHSTRFALDNMMSEFKSSAYTPEILIPTSEADKFPLMDKLMANCVFKGAKINTIDGLRVEYPFGWGLIRASNTSAFLTLRFEAKDQAELKRIKKLFSEELTPFINQVEQYL